MVCSDPPPGYPPSQRNRGAAFKCGPAGRQERGPDRRIERGQGSLDVRRRPACGGVGV
ncbi:hypothetical protein BC834DRAFT_334888 [Gloeopeniophorella convolvens]|nr:hypothetical protein BC834DRAFT_334888 [Gloeopeniophorella convolvens]